MSVEGKGSESAMKTIQNVDTSKFTAQSIQQDSGEAAQMSGFSFKSYTKQFGSWLTSLTEGERIEVSTKDLNAIAPVSF